MPYGPGLRVCPENQRGGGTSSLAAATKTQPGWLKAQSPTPRGLAAQPPAAGPARAGLLRAARSGPARVSPRVPSCPPSPPCASLRLRCPFFIRTSVVVASGSSRGPRFHTIAPLKTTSPNEVAWRRARDQDPKAGGTEFNLYQKRLLGNNKSRQLWTQNM